MTCDFLFLKHELADKIIKFRLCIKNIVHKKFKKQFRFQHATLVAPAFTSYQKNYTHSIIINHKLNLNYHN